MRRANAAEYQSFSNNGTYKNQVEEENDGLTDALGGKIKALKSLSIDIGTEVRQQNKMLSDMDSDFDQSGGFLSSTMGRLGKLAQSAPHRMIWYLFLFAGFVFFICWMIIKFR